MKHPSRRTILLVAVGPLFACLDSPTAPAAQPAQPAATPHVEGDAPLSFAALSPGEEVAIEYRSDGCFHHYQVRVTIQRDSSGAVVRLDSVTAAPGSGWHFDPQRRLTAGQLAKLDDLLAFYRTNTDTGCTTVDHITLTGTNGKGDVRREAYVDGSCDTDERAELFTLDQLVSVSRDARGADAT